MDAVAEIGRKLVRKHHIQSKYGDEQADAGRYFRTRFCETKLLGPNGDREMFIFPVQLATSSIGNLTRLILTLAICDDHTYIRTYIHAIISRTLKAVTSRYCARVQYYVKSFIGGHLGRFPQEFIAALASTLRHSYRTRKASV